MASDNQEKPSAQTGQGAFVVVGQFAGPHGVRGEFKLRSFTEDPQSIGAYGPLRADDGRTLTPTLIREVKPGLFVARADQIATREDCDAWSAARLSVPRDALPPPDEDEFYLSDLVGLRAITTKGEPAGRVKAVVNHGAGDLIELSEVPGRNGIIVIGFTRDDVPALDPGAGTITVVLPDADDPAPDDGQDDAQDDPANLTA